MLWGLIKKKFKCPFIRVGILKKPGINPVFYSNGECLRFLPEKQINKIWGADERDDDAGGDAVRRDDIVTD